LKRRFKALQKDKEKRFQSAEEMLQALAPNLASAELYQRASYCMRGIGMQRDVKAAVELLRLAAQRGCADSMYELSLEYASGDHITADEQQALAWCRQAAEVGHSFAMVTLGQYHLYGLMGCSVDLKTATEWFNRAAALGNDVAMWRLANMPGDGDSTDKEKEIGYWVEKAAIAGHATAMYCLGGMFMEGTYTKVKDRKRASDWLRKAARRKVDRASELLLENGYPVVAAMDTGVATPPAIQFCNQDELTGAIKRFCVGDWGEAPAYLWQHNDAVIGRSKLDQCIRRVGIVEGRVEGRYALDADRILIVIQDFNRGGYLLRLKGEEEGKWEPWDT
jgi:hypothetical protein